MSVRAIKLSPALRLIVYITLTVLFVSGVVWAGFSYLGKSSEDAASPWKSWSLQIHGGAAMATLVLIGMLLSTHVRNAWRARRNRSNGVVLISLLGILILTGYFLYYASNERLRACSSWIHIVLGFLLPMMLVFHVVAGRRSRG
jgi:hypothetical protein